MSTSRDIRVAVASYAFNSVPTVEDWRMLANAWVQHAADLGADLIVFPEYASLEMLAAFPPDVQQDMGRNLSTLQELLDSYLETFALAAAQAGKLIVAPSIPVWVEDRYVNRAFVFSPRGMVGWQDKFFMTRFEDEDWGVASPADLELTLFEAEWGSFGIQTCYDVEFPLGSGLLCGAGAELIVVPSCTETVRGATRVHVGARARALENQCWVAVAQTVGDAPWSPVVDVNYGYAAVYSTPDAGLPEDGILGTLDVNDPGWLVCSIDFEAIARVRREGQVFNFRHSQEQGYGLQGREISVVRRRV
ncbi:MAG: carbon-nitrogen hydrolase family protein [Bacteroidia bacterium]